MMFVVGKKLKMDSLTDMQTPNLHVLNAYLVEQLEKQDEEQFSIFHSFSILWFRLNRRLQRAMIFPCKS
jgi:hypothetical protein